jgi:hypothetical protein
MTHQGLLTHSIFERWIIVNADEQNLAWSGSRRVEHHRGLPAESIQISNFESVEEALAAARQAHIPIVDVEWPKVLEGH